MIDKFCYWFFGWWDIQCQKIDELTTFKFPKPKRKKNVKSHDNRMNFPLEENICPTFHKDFGCVCGD